MSSGHFLFSRVCRRFFLPETLRKNRVVAMLLPENP